VSSRILLEEIDEVTKLIEPLLWKYAFNYYGNCAGLYDKISYTLPDVGIRIRPFLVRMGYEAGGGNFEEILPIAAAIELMQISTLVIDDILDEAETRNRRETVAKKWGKEIALLVGNMLYLLSERTLTDALFTENIDLERAKKVENIFRNTYEEIHIGQYLDLVYENEENISKPEYLDMIKKTTALFIQTPIRIGAILSNCPAEIVNPLHAYGLSLGYAYQIRDDVIDIIGKEEFTGKPFAGDIKRRKKRLPVIHAFLNGSKSTQERLRTLFEEYPMSDRGVKEVVKIVYDGGSVDYSINMVRQFCNQAVEEISELEDSRIKNLLTVLAELVGTFDTYKVSGSTVKGEL